MNLNRATRTRILADMTLDIDPEGSTVEVKIDGDWHAAEWVAAATVTGGRWLRTARTTGYFCGPDATPSGATVLERGRHPTKTGVAKDGDRLVAESNSIDVR